jgi:hypothetical protein
LPIDWLPKWFEGFRGGKSATNEVVAPPRVELKDHLGADEPNVGHSLRSGGPVGVIPPVTKPVIRDRNDIPTRTVRFEDQVSGPTHQTQPNSIRRQDGVIRSLDGPTPAP